MKVKLSGVIQSVVGLKFLPSHMTTIPTDGIPWLLTVPNGILMGITVSDTVTPDWLFSTLLLKTSIESATILTLQTHVQTLPRWLVRVSHATVVVLSVAVRPLQPRSWDQKESDSDCIDRDG